MVNQEWKQIEFGVDLISLAKKHLEFLATVDSEDKLYDGEILNRAIYRYERFWLPFCANLEESGYDVSELFPPTDIAWVWHCHLLCPLAYINDCKSICGRVIDHTCHSIYGIRDRQRNTIELWERNLRVAFDFKNSDSIGDVDEYKSFNSRLSYDLVSASARQKGFYYQVSLPHFETEEFLKLCLDRYKKFLILKKLNPNEFVVPCYGIDIIWHTHQLCPRMYAQETTQLLGYVFPHDDSVNDRNPGSKLNTSGDRTKQLWKETFGEDFFFPGAMYRGDKPDRPHFSSNHGFEFKLFYSKSGSVLLAENRLICTKDAKHPEKTKYRLVVTQSRKRIYEGELNVRDVLRFGHSVRFDQTDEKSLDFRVWADYKEKLSEKFVHALKLESKSDSKNVAYFDPKLIVPARGIEFQTFALNLKDPNGNEFKIDQKWKIEAFEDKSIGFDLIQQPFQTIHMMDILPENHVFDIKYRNFNGRKGEGIRAKHVVASTMSNEKVSVFTAEVLHIVSLQWSSVKISLGSKVLATAHLIGWTQLPSNQQIRNDPNCISFDPRSERAMLVRNLKGDYAIVKGKWVGMRRGIPPKSRGMRGIPGDPGRLQITIHQMEPKTIHNITISLNSLFQFETESTKMTVDLKSGKIVAKLKNDKINELEIESNLAIVFGVAVLHVVLQPKPPPFLDPVPLKNTKPRINPYYTTPAAPTYNYRGSRPVQSISMNSFMMFSSIGFHELICLPSFHDQYCESFYNHHHDSCDNNHHDYNDGNYGDNEPGNCGEGANYSNDYGSPNGNNDLNSWFPDPSSGGDIGNSGGGTNDGGCSWFENTNNSSGNETSDWGNTGCGGCGGGSGFDGNSNSFGGGDSGWSSSCGGGGATSSCGGGATSSCGGGGTSSCGGGGSSCGGGGGGGGGGGDS